MSLQGAASDEVISFKQRLLCSDAQKQNALPPAPWIPAGVYPEPFDSTSLRSGQALSKGWNDEDDMPVIPGEHRETRNPGASSFCLYA